YHGASQFNKPYKFFKINNPGIGAWKYAILEVTPPDTTEPLRVYMANEADLVLDFFTDQERYFLTNDQNNNPIPEEVVFTATLRQGGELSETGYDTKTVGEPVTDAIIGIQVTAPDGQVVVGPLTHMGDGVYTLTLVTMVLGNYDVSVIASDNVPNGNVRNSQYLITTEHSFYVSPYEEPTELTGKLYIQRALDSLLALRAQYCPSNNNCSWDNNTKKDFNNAISYLETALGYFEPDGNHLKSNKGLNFYDKVTSATNKIYSYISSPEFGSEIDLTLYYLITGSYKLAVIVRDEAEEPGACQVSNCEELLQSANRELGKAIDERKQDNYVYIFNHLTNSWKFAMNAMGANLRKQSGEEVAGQIPSEYALDQNYPNPFNPSTTIDYQLPENNNVSLKVYDILGNLVTTLVDQEMDAGYYTVSWNAGNLASGVYIYRFVSDSFISSKKLILMK
ncbi:MAG: T9SS type A sorting domain-containing protein, partial [Ignavibacteriaceae bacterium]|nr:T9SS type A sorting domain-containing protein [Ignavibacteriaceae bacterium]